MFTQYNKGLTVSKEELGLIGFYIETALQQAMSNGASPQRFKALKEIKARLEQSKK